MSPTERGSRRHVLDLLASADAPNQLDALLAPAGYHLVRPQECRPVGPDSGRGVHVAGVLARALRRLGDSRGA
jgi:hypothetical protein